MAIENLNVSSANGTISWTFAGKELTVKFDSVKSARYYEHENLILVLTGGIREERKLIAVAPNDGEIIFTLNPPDNYCFYYLTTVGDEKNEQMAVACLDITNDRGFDVFFQVEPHTHTLSEHGRQH